MGSILGIIGFGEVGGIFGRGLREKPGVSAVHAWDLKFAGEAGEATRAAASVDGIVTASSMAELCASANLLVSAVTASNTLAVAEEAARHVRPGTVFLDLNSASPGTKQRAASCSRPRRALCRSRRHDLGAALRHPCADAARRPAGGGAGRQLLVAWGMDAKPVSEKLGVASAIKMSRSIMIKGLEALVIESYTNARRYGVEDHVLPTLKETFPQIDWDKQGAYFFSRVVQHGKRRAEEMRESANTVQEGGFAPLMASAIAEKQDWVAGLAREGVFDSIAAGARWQDYADCLIAHAAEAKEG
jgi:3-hydroxyisobutyrate dehydrogenase-like beta-hydroxyacid dehydrogenase